MTEENQLLERVIEESGKSSEEIKEMIEKRKAVTHGLLSDYGALYAVAKELGVDVGGGNEKVSLAKLTDIKPRTSVNTGGRVKSIFPMKEFERKDGGTGKLASLILVDGSGEMRLVLWDGNAEAAENVNVGDVIVVRNGFGKEGYRGGVELHAGSMSSVMINPSMETDYPEIKEDLYKISDLQQERSSVNLVCRILSYYPPVEFTRSDGSSGFRASFIGEDDSGTIRGVLWGETAKTPLERGDVIKIENAYTKEGLNHTYELQVGDRSRINKTDADLGLKPLDTFDNVKISEIKPDMSGFTVNARILRIYEPRQYSGGVMSSMVIGDQSATTRVVIWNDKAEIASELKRGDAISIKNAYARANLNQEPEVHVGKYTELLQNPDLEIPPLEEIEKALVTQKQIIDLQNNDSFVKITGRIVDIDDGRGLFYMTCSICNKKIQNLGDMWFCESCNETVEPQTNLKLALTMEDATGSVRVIAFRTNAEKILGMDAEEIMNIVGETEDEIEPIRKARETLIDREMVLIGRVKYNDFSDQLEFIVDEVEDSK